eukprot:8343059-Pyramimonas_sp.AAC.1
MRPLQQDSPSRCGNLSDDRKLGWILLRKSATQVTHVPGWQHGVRPVAAGREAPRVAPRARRCRGPPRWHGE